MGKTIGMDVIPHTDRFSEAAVGTPQLFEWMRMVDRRIVDHSDRLAETRWKRSCLPDWLMSRGQRPRLSSGIPDTDGC